MLKYKVASEKDGTLRKVSWTRKWVVVEPFRWWKEYDDHSKGSIVVEKDFETDMWSIPRIFWVFLDPTKWLAFVLHDYLYTKITTTRKEADEILFEALLVEGCSKIEAYIIYMWVRIGGWIAWRKSK